LGFDSIAIPADEKVPYKKRQRIQEESARKRPNLLFIVITAAAAALHIDPVATMPFSWRRWRKIFSNIAEIPHFFI
jgi:hypothetical protein